MLRELVTCGACGKPLLFSEDSTRQCCDAPHGSVLRGEIIIHDSSRRGDQPPEMIERDQDAFNYLSHPKFHSQIDRLRHFVRSKSEKESEGIVLDLGCGPGPTTGMLLDAGYEVIAVDFSLQCLAVNAQSCLSKADHVHFVQADLNAVEFSEGAFDGLMMADFLQHMGSAEMQASFLHKIIRALRPGGWFYLSFFNTSIFDRIRGDLEGVHGNIPYRRLSLGEVRRMLPKDAIVKTESVMNVLHGSLLDRFVSNLPFASMVAKMGVIEGERAI